MEALSKSACQKHYENLITDSNRYFCAIHKSVFSETKNICELMATNLCKQAITFFNICADGGVELIHTLTDYEKFNAKKAA